MTHTAEIMPARPVPLAAQFVASLKISLTASVGGAGWSGAVVIQGVSTNPAIAAAVPAARRIFGLMRVNRRA